MTNPIILVKANGQRREFSTLDSALQAQRRFHNSYLTKKCVSVIGRGTSVERRIVSDLDLYYSPACGWVSIP